MSDFMRDALAGVHIDFEQLHNEPLFVLHERLHDLRISLQAVRSAYGMSEDLLYAAVVKLEKRSLQEVLRRNEALIAELAVSLEESDWLDYEDTHES